MNQLFKALGHPVRRQIIAMLQDGPLTSGEIAAAFDLTWPTITSHLTTLKEAKLVETEREANTIRYRLIISAAEEAVGFLLGVTQAAKKAGTSAPAMAAETNATSRTKGRKLI